MMVHASATELRPVRFVPQTGERIGTDAGPTAREPRSPVGADAPVGPGERESLLADGPIAFARHCSSPSVGAMEGPTQTRVRQSARAEGSDAADSVRAAVEEGGDDVIMFKQQ